MPDATTGRSRIKAIALDDPWGALETVEGATAVRWAVDRLRRAGYAQSNGLVADPALGQNRPVWMFQRFWKGVTWVVLASWDGSLAYRVPVDQIHPEDPFKVPLAEEFLDEGLDDEDLPNDRMDDAARERLRQVRWTRVGLFTDVVEGILDLPDPPGLSHFAARSVGVAV